MRTRYSRRAWATFETLFRPWMRHRLDGVHIRGLEHLAQMPDLPVLLMANHVSWWDGFLLREVHRRARPDAPLHVVMLEEELRRVPIFRWMGAVPLGASRLAPRALLRDLRARLEHRPDAMIGYFPQGRIWPSHRPELGFRRGAAWLVARLAPVIVLPVGLHLEHLNRPGPAAFVSVGPPQVARHPLGTAELEAAVGTEVSAILACTRQHGEDAARHWSRSRPGLRLEAVTQDPRRVGVS
jgi:1-acyl-sn-glycerol-3-phosphate acyltransferase